MVLLLIRLTEQTGDTTRLRDLPPSRNEAINTGSIISEQMVVLPTPITSLL